jgi:hypothetical protein
VAALALLLALSGVASAHGELILQLGAERIQPGGTVEVRGDLGQGESFEVALISRADGSRRLIATIPATEEGHFQSFVTVPADVPGGDYLVEVAVDLAVVRAPLTVAGAPVDGVGGGGPEQEEGLLPVASSGVSATGAPGAGTPGRTAAVVRAQLDGLVAVGLAATGAVVLLAGLRLATRSQPGRRTKDDRGGAP